MEYLETQIIEDFSGGFGVGFFAGPGSHLSRCLRKYYFKLKYRSTICLNWKVSESWRESVTNN